MFPLYYTLYPKKMEKRKVTRSTAAQIKLIIDYMSTHVDFANNEGEYASPLNNKKKDDEWRKLASMLRKHGPDKSIDRWKCSWRDLKKKARDEIKRIQTESTDPIPELSQKYIKILNTIGIDNLTVDETENAETTESRDSQNSTKEEVNTDGTISTRNIEFVDYQPNLKRAVIKQDVDEDANEEHSSNENLSEKELSEHEFEHSFHLQPKRRKTAESIEPGEASEEQNETDEYNTFGLLVSQKIRKLNYRHRVAAQQRIIQILFDMEMEEIKT